MKPDAEICDQSRYVNSLDFPGIVLPKRAKNEKDKDGKKPPIAPPFANRGVKLGDVAIAFNPKNGLAKGAFVFDTGPRRNLGEGSVRLLADLKNEALPSTAAQSNGMGLGDTFVVLFPASVSELGSKDTWTPAKVREVAERKFLEFGNGSRDNAVARLKACAAAYKSH
jgi:hypothetical protein